MADTVEPKKGMSKGVKIAIGCGAFVILAIICAVIVSVMGLAGVAQVANSIEEKEKTAFDQPAKINDKIVVKDVEWTVIEAKELGSTIKSKYESYGTDCVANSGKFIQIKVKIKNNAKEIATVMNLDVYDSEKKEYKTSNDVFGCVEGDLFILSNVNPGIEKTFIAVYEVPTTAKNLRVKVGDLNLFSDEHKYVALGF